MNSIKSLRSSLKGCFMLGAALFAVSGNLQAATFTVTTTNDSGAGSLRQAILDVNASIDPTNTIDFDLGPFLPAGVYTIQPLTDLPAITHADTLVDGYTQTGSTVNTDPVYDNAVLQVEINGSNYTVGNGVTTGVGLTLGSGSDGSTIRGIIFNEWALAGIKLIDSPGSKVLGNFIGTVWNGYYASANRTGVWVDADSVGAIIGSALPEDRNLFAGDLATGNGSCLYIEANNVLTKGNLFGLTKMGEDINSGAFAGITLISVTGNTVGGVTSHERNVVSGNTYGIYLVGSSTNTIRNNYVGTNANGSLPVGNTDAGIILIPSLLSGSSTNTITFNVISGNGTGLKLGDSSIPITYDINGFPLAVDHNIVQSNFIGTDWSGFIALGSDAFGFEPIGNKYDGIYLFNGITNTIGGGAASQINVISGNGRHGMNFDGPSAFNFVMRNFIGLDVGGNQPVGNGGWGIVLGSESNNNLIGSPVALAGNIISANEEGGVLVLEGAQFNWIRGNTFGADFAGMNPIPNGGYAIKTICAPETGIIDNYIPFCDQKGIKIIKCCHRH